MKMKPKRNENRLLIKSINPLNLTLILEVIDTVYLSRFEYLILLQYNKHIRYNEKIKDARLT